MYQIFALELAEKLNEAGIPQLLLEAVQTDVQRAIRIKVESPYEIQNVADVVLGSLWA